MPACDLTASDRDRFLAGELPPAARRQVLEHLLAGCAACRAQISQAWPERIHERSALAAAGELGAAPALRLDRILDGVEQRRAEIIRERAEAGRRLDAFLRHPAPRQWTLVRNSRRLDTPAFCAALLDAALRAIYDDPHRTLELAEMALEIALRLDLSRYPAPLVADVAGAAWRHVGNARRALGDLAGAAGALARGRDQLEHGTGDPLGEAEQLYFEASQLRAERRLEEALRRTRASRRIYRQLEECHLEGRSLLNETAILSLMGRVDAALVRARWALERIDPARDPQLALAATHNFAWNLQERGALEEARETIAAARPRYEELGDRLSLLRLTWLEARICRKANDDRGAEQALRAAIDGFAESSLPYEAAAVSLELAAILADQGRLAELKRVAAETLVLFRSLGVAREAIAAWLVFERAAAAEKVSAALLERLARYYSEAKGRPVAIFDPVG